MMRQWGAQERHVMLHLDVPETYVLLSDYENWHYPLNYWYLPENEHDMNQFEAKCEEKKVSYYLQKPLNDQELHQEIEHSWPHIFHCNKQNATQATLWCIKPSWVQYVQDFGKNNAP